MHGPEDVMYSMVSKANNTVFYIWGLLRALKVSSQENNCNCVVVDANKLMQYPLIIGDTIQDPSECLKPWLVLNLIYISIYTYLW